MEGSIDDSDSFQGFEQIMFFPGQRGDTVGTTDRREGL